MISAQLSGLILDYLDVRPEMRVRFALACAEVFHDAAAVRVLEITGEGAVDVDISDDPAVLDAHSDAAKRVLVLTKRMNVLEYIRLRLSHKDADVIRIRPESEGRDVYMSSLSGAAVFRKTYAEAQCGTLGKVLVALKVALTPACFYPVMVVVR